MDHCASYFWSGRFLDFFIMSILSTEGSSGRASPFALALHAALLLTLPFASLTSAVQVQLSRALHLASSLILMQAGGLGVFVTTSAWAAKPTRVSATAAASIPKVLSNVHGSDSIYRTAEDLVGDQPE